MKHIRISNENNEPISDNLSSDCLNCLNSCYSIGRLVECPLYGGNRRQGQIKNKKSSTFLCCDTCKTTKLFREKLEALSYAFPDLIIPKKEIEERTRNSEQQKVNRLVHNLSSINAHNIQEIYDIVPQEQLSKNWKNQLDFLTSEIKANPKKAAMMFLRLAKNSIHMKSEFSIYRKLDREDSVDLDFRFHSIKNVLLNVLHTFFADFSNNNIYVMVEEFYGKVQFDYETVQVAIYHLIENATKYAKLYSTIQIDFAETKTDVKVNFKMTSTFIEPDERELIFSEGFSGSVAKKMHRNGDGIGMWRIQQMMKLNKGSFSAVFGDKSENIMGFDFAQNIFTLRFRK